MRRKLSNLSKLMLLVFVFCFIAGGWSMFCYQQEQGVPVTPNRADYVRLHILANSDNVEDQQLKLKVRDAVIAYLTPYVKDVNDAAQAKDIIASRQQEIIQVAKNTLNQNGSDYPVTVQMGNFEFPVRSYGNLVLPAGEYQAVRILIGQGTGQNWWCVLFPPLCFIDGAAAPVAPVTAFATVQEGTAKTPQIRWKIAELFNK